MSDVIVVDASTALKWVLAEAHSSSARALLRDCLTDGRPIAAPAILPSEATNAIYQHQRRKEISPREADGVLASFLAFPVRLVSPPDLYETSLVLARRYRLRATYDAQYLAVALALDAEFWTADARLYESVPRSQRWVRWIADYDV